MPVSAAALTAYDPAYDRDDQILAAAHDIAGEIARGTGRGTGRPDGLTGSL